jgi:hypothetical protein
MNEKIKTIAEYDGWEVIGEPEFKPPYKIWAKQLPQGDKVIPYISPSGKEYSDWHKELKYLTSLDWLHPVAMKVMEGIRAKELELIDYYNNQPFRVDGDVNHEVIYAKQKIRIEHGISNILLACSFAPINGEYIDLFNAVYEGIVYLKSQNNGNNS